jgi:hypothetical protein
VIFAYDDKFQPISHLHGHYWAIVPLRRKSLRKKHLQLSDFIQSDLPRRGSRTSKSTGGVNPEGHAAFANSPDQQPLDADPMQQDTTAPADQISHDDPMPQDSDPPPPSPQPQEEDFDLSNVDMELDIQILEQIELPPICVD